MLCIPGEPPSLYGGAGAEPPAGLLIATAKKARECRAAPDPT